MGFGKARLLIIGLDAATFSVINPLFKRGKLPNLKSILDSGAAGTLKSTMPPLSPAAWVSAMTGRNPGKHGVYDFRKLNPHDLNGRHQAFTSSQDYAGTTIFDILVQAGMRVGAFNIPLTYPAWKVNGVMVSGPITPDHRKAYTYPPELSESLGELARHINPDHLQSFAEDAFQEELIWDTQRHFQVALQLLEQEGPFDLFWFHLHTLDSAQHRFWRYTDPDRFDLIPGDRDRFSETINDLYCLADEGVGRLLQCTGPESLVLVVSDHGAGPKARSEVRFNAWLRRVGLFSIVHPNGGTQSQRIYYERLKRLVPKGLRSTLKTQLPEKLQSRIEAISSLKVDWQATQAFFFPLVAPVGGININLVGRQPQGSVRPENYQSVRETIYAKLESLSDPDSGKPILKEIYTREELYSGPFANQAPDILFQLDPDFYPSGDLADPWMVQISDPGPDAWSGVHTPDGILIARGSKINPGITIEGANIIDLAPTILYALGLPIPADMDGKVLEKMFTGDFLDLSPVIPGPPLGTLDEKVPALSGEEDAAMLERLRFLGYID